VKLVVEVHEAEHLPIQRVRLTFDSTRLNVLLGRNSVGKTLIARLLKTAITKDEPELLLLDDRPVKFTVELDGETYRYSITHQRRVVWRDAPYSFEPGYLLHYD